MAKTNIPNAWNRLDVLSYLDQLYNKKNEQYVYKATAIHLICTKESMNSMCQNTWGFFFIKRPKLTQERPGTMFYEARYHFFRNF